jgi:hypothetical protein
MHKIQWSKSGSEHHSTCGEFVIQRSASGKFKLWSVGSAESLSAYQTLSACKDLAESLSEEIVSVCHNAPDSEKQEAREEVEILAVLPPVDTESDGSATGEQQQSDGIDASAPVNIPDMLTDSVPLPAKTKSSKSGKSKTLRAKSGKSKGIAVPETKEEESDKTQQVPIADASVTQESSESEGKGEDGGSSENAPTSVVRDLSYMDGETEDWGHGKKRTAWDTVCGTYRVSRISSKGSEDQWTACRINEATGDFTISVEIHKSGGNHVVRYKSGSEAFSAVVAHASDKGKLELSGNYAETLSAATATPVAPPAGEKKERKSNGARAGAVHGTADEFGETHEAHKLVMAVIKQATLEGKDATMKDITSAVAAAGFVKSNGKANTYYVFLNDMRERGVIRKESKGFRLVASSGGNAQAS